MSARQQAIVSVDASTGSVHTMLLISGPFFGDVNEDDEDDNSSILRVSFESFRRRGAAAGRGAAESGGY